MQAKAAASSSSSLLNKLHISPFIVLAALNVSLIPLMVFARVLWAHRAHIFSQLCLFPSICSEVLLALLLLPANISLLHHYQLDEAHHHRRALYDSTLCSSLIQCETQKVGNLFISCTFRMNYAEIFISICDEVFCAMCKPFSSHILSRSHTSSNRGYEWHRLKIISFKRGDSYSWELWWRFATVKNHKSEWMCWQHIEGPRLEESLAAWLCSGEGRARKNRNNKVFNYPTCLFSQRYQKSFLPLIAKCIRRVSYFVIYCSFIASLVCITWENSFRKMIFFLASASRFSVSFVQFQQSV